jgi:hypothetical protein
MPNLRAIQFASFTAIVFYGAAIKDCIAQCSSVRGRLEAQSQSTYLLSCALLVPSRQGGDESNSSDGSDVSGATSLGLTRTNAPFLLESMKSNEKESEYEKNIFTGICCRSVLAFRNRSS